MTISLKSPIWLTIVFLGLTSSVNAGPFDDEGGGGVKKNQDVTWTGDHTHTGTIVASTFTVSSASVTFQATSDTMTVNMAVINFDSGSFYANAGTNRVGIGTTAPTNTLTVGAPEAGVITGVLGVFYTGDTWLTLRNTIVDMEAFFGVANGAGFILGSATNDDVLIRTNNNTKLTLKAAGNFGVNDTSPDALLEVKSNAAPTAYVVQISSQNDTTAMWGVTGNGGMWLAEQTSTPTAPSNAAGLASITTAGNAELKAIDELGNVTQLSSHRDGRLYDISENLYTGRKFIGDREMLYRIVEQLAKTAGLVTAGLRSITYLDGDVTDVEDETRLTTDMQTLVEALATNEIAAETAGDNAATLAALDATNTLEQIGDIRERSKLEAYIAGCETIKSTFRK